MDAFLVCFVEAVELAKGLNNDGILESISRPIRCLDGVDDSIQADFPRPVVSYISRFNK